MRELNFLELSLVCGGDSSGGTATAGPGGATATCPTSTPIAVYGQVGGNVSYGGLNMGVSGQGAFATCY